MKKQKEPNQKSSHLNITVLWLLLFIVAWSIFPACSDKAPEGESTANNLLATINGAPVTRADLEGELADQLAKLELDYEKNKTQLLAAGLTKHIHDQLLKKEAAARGTSTQALLMDEVGRAQITDEDVERWHQQNSPRVGGRSFEEVAPQIRQFLNQQAQSEQRDNFMKQLEQKNNVVYLLEPFRVDVPSENSPALGSEDAPVTIVEFSDFECPYCQNFASTLKAVKTNYGDKVRLVFMQFPLGNHPNAKKAAEAALCANEQGRFWEMHDLLFAERDRLQVDQLKEKAKRLELAPDAFNDCLDSDRYAEQVQKEQQAGSAVGVTGTPAAFVNGRPLPAGAIPYEAVSSVVDEELERSNSRNR